MAASASTPRCDVPWCRAPHWPGDRPDHTAQLALWRIQGIEIGLSIGQAPGCEPVVRLTRGDGDGHRWFRDVDPAAATDWADVLDTLPDRMRELVAALRTAVEALGK
ncbi:hypothetical protein FAF44_33865 [Nonomuraea sp. MG754425]|uniref:hypothetical protein n=1 Tax=Nonomuraea sp. MG754425 TaxID=2570319 RepID=UPI001F3A0800|nr:hypothetical protein [Nonomuraea sp. MG754425]MCF6473334.1 hypothetical protein [Nonomuraea sp. MG754425]